MLASKNQARVIILSTFFLGVLTGALAMNLFSLRPAPAAGNANRQLMEELAKEVKLAPEQRAQVEQILAETRQQYQELQKQVHPQFNQIRQATRTRIRALLTPEQQALYDEWNRKRDLQRGQKMKGAPHAEGR